VTVTKGHEFEDYYLKRELLMGIFEKGIEMSIFCQRDRESLKVNLCFHFRFRETFTYSRRSDSCDFSG
jgi:ATP-dependent RNA helicase DDX6/DHH1